MERVEENYINRDLIFKLNFNRVRKINRFLDYIIIELCLENLKVIEDTDFYDKLVFFERFIGRKYIIVEKRSRNYNDKNVNVFISVTLRRKYLYLFLNYLVNILYVNYLKKYSYVYFFKKGYFSGNLYFNIVDKNIILNMGRDLSFLDSLKILFVKNKNREEFEIKYYFNSFGLK